MNTYHHCLIAKSETPLPPTTFNNYQVSDMNLLRYVVFVVNRVEPFIGVASVRSAHQE